MSKPEIDLDEIFKMAEDFDGLNWGKKHHVLLDCIWKAIKSKDVKLLNEITSTFYVSTTTRKVLLKSINKMKES